MASDGRSQQGRESADERHRDFAQQNAAWDRRVKKALSAIDKAAGSAKRAAGSRRRASAP
jgi:hypothetical protein